MKQKLSIIGGGPAGMMLACSLDSSLYNITIYEKNNTLGRKFLVAGKGGFNLTHSEPIEELIKRYTPPSFLCDALKYFTNIDLVNWLNEMEVPTYIGSSKRIFPNKEIKPAFVLQQFISRIKNNKVKILTNMTWNGWNEDDHLVFNDDEIIKSDLTVFALGGSSWKVTGSDGNWLDNFTNKGILTKHFEASNGALFIQWDANFMLKNEGKAIKNITLFTENTKLNGDLTITKNGIEGSPAYALNGIVRAQLKNNSTTLLFLDLKPSLSSNEIIIRLNQKRKKSWSDHIKSQLKLSDIALSFIQLNTNKEEYIDVKFTAQLIKNIPLEITGLTFLDEAISTVGGIELNAVNKHYELLALPTNFVIGEMLDWDAPTGGYLLQACFSMGAYLANILNNDLKSK